MTIPLGASAGPNQFSDQSTRLPFAVPAVPFIPLSDIDISQELLSRRVSAPNRRAESAAMYASAEALTQGPGPALKQLARHAVELCDADSGGVSVIEATETDVLFRWRALAGEVERYEGGSTPRDWSPCCECLKAGRAILYSYPERHFTYLQQLGVPIVEGLVIPVLSGTLPLATVWVASHTPECQFNAEHVRIMTSLGDFTSSALEIASALNRESHLRNVPLRERPLGYNSQVTKNVHLSREIVWREYVKRVSLGDENALEALFAETRSLVFATALRIVGFQADAEEVAVDVYTRIWLTAATYNVRRGNVSGWLLSIARSVAIDRLRSRAVRQHTEEELLSQCTACDELGTLISASERRTQLRRALAGLSSEQRRAIELFYFSEMRIADIAAKLGDPIGTVKSRVRSGTIKLRRLMGALEKAPARRKFITSAAREQDGRMGSPTNGSSLSSA